MQKLVEMFYQLSIDKKLTSRMWVTTLVNNAEEHVQDCVQTLEEAGLPPLSQLQLTILRRVIIDAQAQACAILALFAKRGIDVTELTEMDGVFVTEVIRKNFPHTHVSTIAEVAPQENTQRN